MTSHQKNILTSCREKEKQFIMLDDFVRSDEFDTIFVSLKNAEAFLCFMRAYTTIDEDVFYCWFKSAFFPEKFYYNVYFI